MVIGVKEVERLLGDLFGESVDLSSKRNKALMKFAIMVVLAIGKMLKEYASNEDQKYDRHP